MEEHVHINLKSSPYLLDRPIQDIQKILTDKLAWLQYAFGRCYKITDFDNNIKEVFPAVYNSNREYISVLPNDNFGNFSFFDVYDPQKIDNKIIGKQKITFKCGLVFWFKLDEIYSDETKIFTEEIKHEILTILKTSGIVKNGRVNIIEVLEKFENIYKGYNIEKLHKQFFLYPYSALRFELEIVTFENC